MTDVRQLPPDDRLWNRDDVAAFFCVSRRVTYSIRGIESCRVKVPGTRLVRFSPAKVRALTVPKQRAAS